MSRDGYPRRHSGGAALLLLIAAVALICLSFIDNTQLKHLGDAANIDDPAALSESESEIELRSA